LDLFSSVFFHLLRSAFVFLAALRVTFLLQIMIDGQSQENSIYHYMHLNRQKNVAKNYQKIITSWNLKKNALERVLNKFFSTANKLGIFDFFLSVSPLKLAALGQFLQLIFSQTLTWKPGNIQIISVINKPKLHLEISFFFINFLPYKLVFLPNRQRTKSTKFYFCFTPEDL